MRIATIHSRLYLYSEGNTASGYRRSFVAFACVVLIYALFMLSVLGSQSNAQTIKRVALVFDDGPTPQTAIRLLETLEAEGVRVSFAQVAANVELYTKLSLETRSRGHEIVNHSYEHRNVDELSDEELNREIVGAQKRMTELLGQAPAWYWPPFLRVNDRVRSTVVDAGLRLFEPDKVVVSMDYDRSVSGDEIESKATAGVVDGSVILFHEWRMDTVERLPSILRELRAQGCVFMTFSELAKAKEQQ